MKTRLLIIIIGIAVFAAVFIPLNFSIEKDAQSYILLCNHWIFSTYMECTPLWNESESNISIMESDLSEESWDELLSLPREDALDKLQKIYDKTFQFFMDLTIIGLKDSYEIGEMPTFTVVQAGYGTPCNEPRIVISKIGDEKPHWDYRFVHSCPFFKDGYPILSYMKVPYNNRIIPPITEPGQYTVTTSSSYDSLTSKQFTVLESDFVYDYTISYTKHGNNTGNILLNIDLNDGNYTLTQNSESIQGVLFSEELNELKQLIDENDLLRGHSSIHHEINPTCRTCITYNMMISLGDYTHYTEWQSGVDRLWENHVPVIDALEKLTHEKSQSLSEDENALRPDDRLEVRHSAGYTTVSITLSSWDEYNDWEKRRGSEHDVMPPIPIDENNINPIVFDLLNEMWKFEDYEISKYNKNLFVKTIQKDYGVSNHNEIHDWLKEEHDKVFGESDDGFSSYFEFKDRVYYVTMLVAD